MYERTAELNESRIMMFQLDQSFIRSVAGSVEAVEEQQAYSIFLAKNEMSQRTYLPNDIKGKLLEVQSRRKTTGNFWDGQPTYYLQQFHHMRLKSWDKLANHQNRFNMQINEKWQKEVDQYQHEEHQKFESDCIFSRARLIEELVMRLGEEQGFALDKKFTRKTINVYTKPCVDQWVLFLAIDIKGLEESLEPYTDFIECRSDDNLLSRPLGPSFYMAFGVANRKTRKSLSSENDQVLPLKFEWFLPIRKVAPLWSDYSKFYSLRELEALVNINFLFYGVLASEFDQAVREGLEGRT